MAQYGTVTLDGFSYPYQFTENINSDHLPLFFVSGAFQQMLTWKHYEKHFSPLAPVLLSDLPGTGSADILPSEYSFAFLATSIKNLLDVLQIEKVHVLSASYGCPIGIIFGIMYPERIGKMILCGATRGFSEAINASFVKQLKDVKEGKMETFKNDVLHCLLNYEHKDQINRFKLAERMLSMSLANFSKDDTQRFIENTQRVINVQREYKTLPDIFIETLLLTGKFDNYTSIHEALKLQKHFPNSTLHIMDAADHLLNIERPNETIREIENFLNIHVDECAHNMAH